MSNAAGGGAAPVLLASVHDISPLTLDACRQAVGLLRDAAGLAPRHLTLLVIPFHEGRVRVCDHPETARWLREMAEAGATLVQHGLTHRMPRAAVAPTAWLWGYGFARGQGELYRAGLGEAERRLAEGREILERAGLSAATRSFVPPAWLLSRAARRAVDAAGFDWIELMDGIRAGGAPRARRLIGWGSLNAVEAAATIAFASLQRARPASDTRLCVHPADMRRAGVRRSIARTAWRLRDRLQPMGYADFLARATGAGAPVTA